MKKISQKKIKEYNERINKIKKEVKKVIVGQDKVVDSLIKVLLCNSHVLVEGVPGIAKTLIIKTLAKTTGCHFSRIQFTVDLLPTDITGITAYDSKKGLNVIKGPIFANFVLADEINRAPPKVQSALLEAMQERQTTIGRKTFPMMQPFFVMATQNPIESVGIYELPEAQIDRFLLKVLITYPDNKEEKEIIENNIEVKPFEAYNVKNVISPKRIIEMQEFIKDIFISEKVKSYITRLVESTRNPSKYGIKLGRYVDFGSSPRASIGLALVGKAEAMMDGKSYVTAQHIKNVAFEVLRHRLILNYEGLARRINPDDIVKETLHKVPIL